MTTVNKGCQRNGKFFLKKEAAILDQIQPDELKKQIIEIWPTTEERKISDSELKSLIQLKITHDPTFREWFKTLQKSIISTNKKPTEKEMNQVLKQKRAKKKAEIENNS